MILTVLADSLGLEIEDFVKTYLRRLRVILRFFSYVEAFGIRQGYASRKLTVLGAGNLDDHTKLCTHPTDYRSPQFTI